MSKSILKDSNLSHDITYIIPDLDDVSHDLIDSNSALWRIITDYDTNEFNLLTSCMFNLSLLPTTTTGLKPVTSSAYFVVSHLRSACLAVNCNFNKLESAHTQGESHLLVMVHTFYIFFVFDKTRLQDVHIAVYLK